MRESNERESQTSRSGSASRLRSGGRSSVSLKNCSRSARVSIGPMWQISSVELETSPSKILRSLRMLWGFRSLRYAPRMVWINKRGNSAISHDTQLSSASLGLAQSAAPHRGSCGARSLLPCATSPPVEKHHVSDQPQQLSLLVSPCSPAFRLTLRD